MKNYIEVLHESRLANVYGVVGEGITALTFLTSVVWDDGEARRTYFKVFSKELELGVLNELTGYLLAKACELPLPSHAGIIRIPDGMFPNQQNFLPEAFVVSEAPGKTPTTICRITDEVTQQQFLAVLKMLDGWKKLNDTVAFDDWTANTDRNLQNIVVDGPGRIFLIDHSNLPVKPTWEASDLDPGSEYENKLSNILKLAQSGTLPQKRSIAVAASDHPAAYNKVLTELRYWWDAILSGDPSRRKALEEFLQIRANEGHERISQLFYMMAV